MYGELKLLRNYSRLKRLAAKAFLVFTLLSPVIVDAQVKQWTDDDGVVHFGNDPRKKPVPPPARPYFETTPTPPPAPLPEMKSIKCQTNLAMPDISKISDDSAARRVAEQGLGRIRDCYAEIEIEFILYESNLLVAAVGVTITRRIEIEGARSGTSLEKAKMQSQVRTAFLNFERSIKTRYQGNLPQWIKDNRDWRTLDKAFQP